MNNRIALLGNFFEYLKGLRNLGDGLQHYAIVKWFKYHYPHFEVKDIFYFTAVDELKKIIKPDDVIVFQSSGAMGDVASFFEKWRLDVCEAFPSNRIIVFPQTVFFQKQENMLKSKRVYEKHRNLTIIARDYESFKLLKKFLPGCHLLIMPDFVLSLKGEFSVSAKKDKKKPLLIFRDDFETNKKGQGLVKKLIKDFDSFNLIFPDTEHSIDLEKRDFVEKVFHHISSYDFVVTDRMHGMIFCAILEIPCICLPGKPEVKYHKNKAMYESWLSQVPYIKFWENNEDKLKEAIKNIFNYDKGLNPVFDRYYPSQNSQQPPLDSRQKSARVKNRVRNFDYLFNYFLPDALGDIRTIKKESSFPG
jgi:pyruvyl transferase EpsI